MRIIRNIALGTTAAVLALSSTAQAGNVVEELQSAGQFETLLQAAEAAGVAETLATEDFITVFAPTDEAFAALPEGAVEELLNQPDQLAEVLKYHVIISRLPAENVEGRELPLETLQGSHLTFEGQGSEITVNGVSLTEQGIEADNGVIHAIDGVLMPSEG